MASTAPIGICGGEVLEKARLFAPKSFESDVTLSSRGRAGGRRLYLGVLDLLANNREG